jgi:hypothetical protein
MFACMAMALWIFGCTAFQYHPRSVAGRQCPTAAVQTVRVAVKDCCGRVVGYETRAPEPGEAAFTQCRCAENQAATNGYLPPKLEPFFLPAPDLPEASAEPRIAQRHYYRLIRYRADLPPPVPPPC